MRKKLREHYIEKYGSICDELDMCIPNDPSRIYDSFEQAIAEIEWHFSCEWDCDLDTWYSEYVK